MQLLTELTRDFPDTPDYHSHLAAALDGLMALPRSMIQLEEARRLIDVAIERQTAAVQANPAHRQYREYLAAHFGNLAAVLEQLGEHDGVDRAYVRRIELLHELAAEDPRRYEHELRTSELAYADWLSLHGEYDRATQLYEELIGVCSAPQASDSHGVETKSLLGGALHGQANILLAQDALDEARQLFQQAVALQEQTLAAEPDAAVCRQWLCRHLCRLGTACYRLGQVDQAKAAWTKAVEVYEAVRDATHASIHDDVAWMLIEGAEVWDAAHVVAIAEAGVERVPASAALWMALGVGRCRGKKWQEAVDALNESIQLGGGNSCLHFFLAIAHWQLGERLESLTWYERAVDGLHEHAAQERDFARCRAEADASIGSAIAIRGTEQPEGTDATATDYVFTLTRFGDTSGSVTVDWATSDGTAKAGRDYVPAAGQLHFAPDETQQQVAVAVYGDAETETAEDFVVSIVDVAGATVAQRRALATILNDDQREPIDRWQTAIRLDPDSAVTHFKRALALWRESGKEAETLADLNRAIELAPDFAQAYYNRGLVSPAAGRCGRCPARSGPGHRIRICRAAKRSTTAASCRRHVGRMTHGIGGMGPMGGSYVPSVAWSHSSMVPTDDFDQALAIGPPRAEFYNNRGVLHVRDGHLDQALADFDEAIRIYPDFLPAWANRALTRARLGQVDLALDEVRTMVEIAASSAEDTDSSTLAWISVPDSESEPLRRFRDEASQIIGVTEVDSTTQQAISEGANKAAGESTLSNDRTHRPGITRAAGLHARADDFGHYIADRGPFLTGVPCDVNCPDEETTDRPPPATANGNAGTAATAHHRVHQRHGV